MSIVSSTKFACDSCKATYTWKPELAGKKAKCKCGYVMTVPKEMTPPPPVEPDEDALYDLADVEEKASHHQPVTIVAAPVAPKPAARPGPKKAAPAGSVAGARVAKAGVPLAYQQGQSQREKDRWSTANLIDFKKDIYAPVILFVLGMVMYVGYYAVHYRLSGGGIAITTMGLGLVTAIKGGVLIGLAIAIANPFGISFGNPWTMALKIIAISCFCDGCLTFVDVGVEKLTGLRGPFNYGAIFSFFVTIGICWVLLQNLFPLETDDWMVVVIFGVLSFFLRTAVVALVLNSVLSTGGARVPAASIGRAAADPIVAEYEEDKETGHLTDAKQYIEDGHQAGLLKYVDQWYANGAKGVYFKITWDINKHTTPHAVVIELPDDPKQRAACYKVIGDYYKEINITTVPVDTGTIYETLILLGGGFGF